MSRYIVIYDMITANKRNAILTLLRTLRNAGGITIDVNFNGMLPTCWIYKFTVNDSATEDLLEYLCSTDHIDYRYSLSDEMQSKVDAKTADGIDDHMSNRHAFVIADGKVWWQPDCMRNVSTADWLTYGCFVYGTEMERVIRGSISYDRVRLYCGRDFGIPEECDIRYLWLADLLNTHHNVYNKKTAVIELGAVPGKAGEEWPAREVLGRFLAPNCDTSNSPI